MNPWEIAATAMLAAGGLDLARGRKGWGIAALAAAPALFLVGRHRVKACQQEAIDRNRHAGLSEADSVRMANEECGGVLF